MKWILFFVENLHSNCRCTIRLDLKKNNSEVFLLNERERIKFGDRAIETCEERERERQRNSERETETERIN